MWRNLSPYPQIILMLLIALTIFILWPEKNLAAPGSTSAVRITSIEQLDCNINPCRGELSGQYQIEVIVRPPKKTIPKNGIQLYYAKTMGLANSGLYAGLNLR